MHQQHEHLFELPPVECQEDLQLIAEIEEKVLDKLNLGFDPEILQILDNEDARQEDIDRIKFKLRPDVVARLTGRANSVFAFGKIKAGDAHNFQKVVMRLGMKPAKVYILALTLFFAYPEFEGLAARSFARAILGRILAGQMSASNAACDSIELGGLLMELGKIPLMLYEKFFETKLEEGFIEQYHVYFGIKMIMKFNLPDFLSEILATRLFTFGFKSLSYGAVVYLADCIVANSFQAHGKLVFESPMPADPNDSTIGSSIRDQFQAIGLRKYVDIKMPRDE